MNKIKLICALLACCCIGSVGSMSLVVNIVSSTYQGETDDLAPVGSEDIADATSQQITDITQSNSKTPILNDGEVTLESLFEKIEETQSHLDNITFQNYISDTLTDASGKVLSESSSHSPWIRLEGIATNDFKLQYEEINSQGVTKQIFISSTCYCENSTGEKYKVSLSKNDYYKCIDAIIPPMLETFAPTDFKEQSLCMMENGHYQIILQNPYGRIWNELLAPFNNPTHINSKLILKLTDWYYVMEVDIDGNIYKKSIMILISDDGLIRKLKNEIVYDEIGIDSYIIVPENETDYVFAKD